MSEQRELSLAYGSGRLKVVPASGRFQTLLAPAAPALSDPRQRLRELLDAPIGAPPLKALLRRRDRVTVVVSDQTRATGIHVLLPPLLAYLDSAGLSLARIHVLFALGIHRPQTAAEQVRVLGADVASRVGYADHDCDDERSLEALTQEGTAAGICLNRRVLDESLVIATGAIAFHYLAGFGGGRKAILPGVASRESVLRFHRLSLASESGGRHPCVQPGVRTGNPLDQLSTAVATSLPRSFLINTLMSPPARDRPGEEAGVMAIVAGDMTRAFDHGCAIYGERCTVAIKARRPVAVVSAGGAPRDCDLVQTQKAIAAAAAATIPGGMMLVLAACGQGTGQADLMRWFSYPDWASHVTALRRDFSVPGQTALALREHAERHQVYLRSELADEVVTSSGMTPIRRLDDFFAEVAARYGADVEGYVLPEGARYLPVTEGGG